jgi:hypothetical protein
MRSLILCLFVASTALAFPADDERKVGAATGGCPGGYLEGAEIERGRIVYECRGGQISPKGCIAEDLSKIPIGSKFDNRHYRRACENSGGDVKFEPTACLLNGQEHKVGETWDDGTQTYTCKQNTTEPVLDAVSVGCVDGGKRINAKEQVPKDDLLYECQPYINRQHKLRPVGCVKDGKQLKAGEAIDIEKFWFNCSLFGRETYVLKAAGCVVNGKRLNDGDRYDDNDVKYECAIDANKNYVRAVACIQREGGNPIDRKLGCEWNEGTAPFMYKWTCKYDEAANTATKVQLSCSYYVSGGSYPIEPGCYRVIDKSAFGCVNQGKTLNLQSFQGENAEQSAQGAGLKAC